MSQFISDTYQKLNADLHTGQSRYGANSAPRAPGVAKFVEITNVKTLLDYGCGKGTLKPAVQALCPTLDIREYDPAMPGKTALPEPAEGVVCLDVLEHIEPNYLEAVLEHIRELATKAVLLAISSAPSSQTLADGRNAHLIQEPKDWWLKVLATKYDVADTRDVEDGFLVLATPKKK